MVTSPGTMPTRRGRGSSSAAAPPTDDEVRGQPEYLSVIRVEAGREVDPAVPVGPIGMTDPGPMMVTSGGRHRIFGGSHNVYMARW